LREAHIQLHMRAFVPLFFFCNSTFFHSGYIKDPPGQSSVFYRQPFRDTVSVKVRVYLLRLLRFY